MKVGDIYIEALRLMHATGGEAIFSEPVDGARSLADLFSDPQYADYMQAMPGALGRAISDVKTKGAVPVRILREWDASGIPFPTVTRYTPMSEELRMPEEIAVLLPYYIAADLYRREEPGLAAEYRNLYEGGIAQCVDCREEGNSQSSVAVTFGHGWADDSIG